MIENRNAIFEPYIRIADAIYAIFKSKCEVVIHDFSEMDKSIIYIKGDLTGRTLGAPITDFVLQQLKNNDGEIEDILGTYSNVKNGKSIKSSIVYIRDNEGKVVGLLGINYNVTELANLQHYLSDILSPFEGANQIRESYASTITEMFEQIILTTLMELNMTLPIKSKTKKIEFVKALDKKGVFLVQGSMDRVSTILQVTKQTVYNYLEN